MAMPIVQFYVSLFDGLDTAHSQKALLWLMQALVRCNEQWLDQYPDTPKLYDAPVRYEREENQEHWQNIEHVLSSGSGDCEDLACWRIAELRFIAGISAQPWIKWRKTPGGMTYHALVKWPDGRIEDPSLALGMGGEMLRRPVFIAPY